MNSGDADMTEAEPVAPAAAAVASNPDDPNDAVRNFLTMARQLINQGKPSQALQAVVMAMKIQGGEEAVSQGLIRARELYVNKIQATAAADELASLLAECVIAEAISKPCQGNMDVKNPELDVEGSSILAETGRKQIVLDAFSDGSSFVCVKCGGLVSNLRKDEHFAFWCCKS